MNEKIAKKIFGNWYSILSPIIKSHYFTRIITTLNKEYKYKNIFPKKTLVFNAFKLTDYRKFRVLILGSEPYPNNRSTGLAFANDLSHISISPILKRINEVIEYDYYNGLNLNFDQTLESWAKQGVLLLNTSLTIEKGKPNSHKYRWENFIRIFLKILGDYNPGTIYVLWGKDAQQYKEHIDIKNNYIIEAEHPLYSSAYKGRKWNFSFKKIDEITYKLNGNKIKW